MSKLALKLIAENKAKHERGEDATALNLFDCEIEKLPKSLEHLIWLEKLHLGSNKRLIDLSLIYSLKKLKKLYFFNTQVNDLSFLIHLQDLVILDCSASLVKEISPTSTLLKLKTFDLSNTLASDLSPLDGLVFLKQLNCSNTRVSDLSPLSTLVNLEELYCSNTRVSDLSPLSNLVKLEELNCSNTRVSDLSPLSNLLQLERLDCSATKITNLSPILHLFKKENNFDFLSRNKINFKKCSISTPPPEITSRGNYKIFLFLEELERAKGNTIRLAEAKCLVLGKGGSGKTSLVNKLINKENPLPTEEATTRGIDVHYLDRKLPDNTIFRINIWDFAGQDIYHHIHQFFLTKRSLYILLDDTRDDDKTVNDTSFNYWLQVAELYGGNSPLLIVQNEKGDRSKQLDLNGMQGRFGFVKDSKATNLLTCRGLDKVWSAIEYWLKQLPHIGEQQPKAWVDIRRELERLAMEEGRDHIPLEEYYRICAQHDIPERERALFLSSYLHDFGAFLHFQDHPLLRKMLVLNNQWATDAVYKVLDCEEVKGDFGRFTRSTLGRIWADDRYADQHNELMALMERFELCYKLPDEQVDTWLAPQLLSVLEPDTLTWKGGNNLQLRYEYEFMPKGLLSQHIVRMHRYVRQPELAWKSGVVFERAGSQALVTEAWGSRNIRIRARGAQAKELLTLLSEDFDKMHERLEGLKVRKMIPCNCRVCAKSTEPHFYEHEDLTTRKATGKKTVECKRPPYEDVSVIGLLDGVFAKDIKEDVSDGLTSSHAVTKPKTIKIFLASSEELLEDRDQFEIFLSRENDYLFEKGIRLQLVRWENFLDAVSATRLQDEYNKELRNCDMVVCLFHTKVGKYTAEEFDAALGAFRGAGKPSIFTYFKDAPVKPSQIRDNSINDFKQKLGELGHFWTKYEALGDLKHHFGEQLKKLGIG